jgi:predicted ester cyclase
MSTYFTAFPDLKIVTEDILVDGENVVTRWTAIGTHNGPLMGIPPSGKSMKVAGISIDRVINGQMVEGWYQFDALGMFQQVGAIPAMA